MIWVKQKLCDATKSNRHKGPIILIREPSGRVELGLMSIPPGDRAAMEVHEKATQTIFVVEGHGIIRGQAEREPLHAGTAVIVPAGVAHEIENTGEEPLKLFTTYSKDSKDKWVH